MHEDNYTYNYDVHVIKVYIKISSLTCCIITLVNVCLVFSKLYLFSFRSKLLQYNTPPPLLYKIKIHNVVSQLTEKIGIIVLFSFHVNY